MRLGNTVEFTHVALGLIPEILNAIDVIVAVCEELRVVDTEVMEVRHIQHIIAAPAVGITMLSAIPSRSMMGISVAPEASGMILV